MTRFLPILVLSLVVSLSSLVTPTFAQEITPTIPPEQQTNLQPQGFSWQDFTSLFIPENLKQVNCAKLPLKACGGISNKTNTAVKPQAEGGGNQDTVVNAAGQYTIASGVHTPPEVSNASTNIILDFFAKIAKILDIFNTGEKEAKNYAGTVLPAEVKDQNFAQGVQNVSDFASENPTVLGAQAGQSAMDRALPLVQCRALPAGLCGADNKPNFLQ